MNYGKNGVKNKQHELTSKAIKMKKTASISFFKILLVAIVALVVLVCAVVFGLFKGIISSAPDISSSALSLLDILQSYMILTEMKFKNLFHQMQTDVMYQMKKSLRI